LKHGTIKAMPDAPCCAVVYTRISDARAEVNDNTSGHGRRRRATSTGVEDQEKRCCELAQRLGWAVGRVIVENDISAFKRRKIALPDGRRELRTVRPGWREMLDLLASGRADGLIALDLDRSARDPRDLEDLIDVVESRSPRIPVESVTGSLRLANDADITMARVMVAVANKASRDTARRVAAARQRQAAYGRYGGGTRAFGYERDGKTVLPKEAAEIVKAARAILAGVSLREVTADLRRRGVPTVHGGPWHTSTVRGVLLSPRSAGIKIYHGQEVGKAEWPAILEESTWRGVVAILTDPARRTAPPVTSPSPKWLLSLIANCGVCGQTVSVGGGRKNNPSYVCRGTTSHMRRVARPTEDFVSRIIIARLSQPDAAELVTRHPEIDTVALNREATAARARLDALARMFGNGGIDVRQLQEGTAAAKADLKRAEDDLAVAAPRDALAGLAGRADAARIWEKLDIGRKRAIVRTLVDVTLVPRGRGGRLPGGGYFDPTGILITWKS
jgi:site-specific DNA recombinase